MQADFAPSLAATLVYEGGYSDNQHDPGGSTMEGVTQRTYDAWRSRQKLPRQTVRKMTSVERDAIYRFQYWNEIKGDELPAGIDMCVFDCAVNSGPREAIVLLQKVLGVKADGHLGLVTLAALEGRAGLVRAYCGLRLGFMHRLRTWRFFSKGWTARVNDVRAKAMKLVGT